ncbi:hypothetical protein ACN42_g5715 [Penicillium freii]|uniref:Uncharacterized protein n=1 Tax=Penicillium freii TaxID=48697 RepID=A0A117NNU8_PENFR|nr:hypothetical protein ACN42_g5715 [Penicillium freii]
MKMSVSEAETISALQVLLNSSKEILQAHRDLTLQTLEQVRSVLAVKSHNNNTTSSNIQPEPLPFCNNENLDTHSSRQVGESSYSPATVLEDRSHAAADPTEILRTTETEESHDADPGAFDTLTQVNARKRKRESAIETRLAKLSQAIEKHLPKFVKFSQNTASLFDLLGNVQSQGTFYMRLDHIKRIDGNKTPNEKEKLLKGLCQVSLAREFTAWEHEQGWSTRVDQLHSQICGSGVQIPKKRQGKISRYLRSIGCCDTDRSVANKALCQGTSQLLFKRLTEEALGDSAPEGVVGGLFSVVAVFEFHQFQLLTVEQLPQLIDFLIPKDAHGHRSLRSSFHSVKEAAAWSESLQSDFEFYCKANRLVMRDTLYQSEAQTEKNGPPKVNTTQGEQFLPSNRLDHSIPTRAEDASRMVSSGNLGEPQPFRTNEYLDESHGFGDNSTGGCFLAFGDYD